MKRYVYFFTRQDISPEQQLVQTAHVAYRAGFRACDEDIDIDPREVYFIVIGVRDLEALNAISNLLTLLDINYTDFSEPDLNNELTSVATNPINEDKRGVLLAFNLLEFKGKYK